MPKFLITIVQTFSVEGDDEEQALDIALDSNPTTVDITVEEIIQVVD